MLSSSISRLLIGPLVSVILPAPASIFFTTPLTTSSWADAADEARTESASAAAASLLSFIFFPFVRFGLLPDHDRSDHSCFPVTRGRAGIIRTGRLATSLHAFHPFHSLHL